MIERRKKRSDDPREAVSLYLAAATEGHGVRAVAVAGEEGALLGGAGKAKSLELLAALGAECGARGGDGGALAELAEAVFGGDDLYASRLSVCDRTVVLASVGARVPRQKAVAAALGRILAPVLDAGR